MRRAQKVVAQSIREVGVAQTAAQANMTVEDLFKYVDHGTPEYQLLLDVAVQMRQTSVAATGVPNFKGKPISPTSTSYSGFHGSGISPEELRSAGGFQASGSNMDLYEHILAKGEASAYRGTTRFPMSPTGEGGAAHWVGEGGWVYEIEAGEAWDTAQIWEQNQNLMTGAHPTRGEFEVAIRGTQPWGKIKGWYKVGSGTTAKQLSIGQYTSRAQWEASQAVKGR